MKKKKVGSKYCHGFIISMMAALILLGTKQSMVLAESERMDVEGQVYSFDEKSEYEISQTEEYTVSNEVDTYGDFFIQGEIGDISDNKGVPAYEITSNNFEIFYTYNDTMLNAGETEWHLIDDGGKKINGIELESNIGKGTIIVQTSKDRMNWNIVKASTNVFSEQPIMEDSLYQALDIELINGCYYRVIVVYETSRLIGTDSFLFIPTKEEEFKKTAEVYEFYAYLPEANEKIGISEQTYSLGEKVRAEKFDGYSGIGTITKEDVHYGWDIGEFFVSGYTDKVEDDGTVVFLKNAGDEVTLWFHLQQEIDRLNGSDTLAITADAEGYDHYFETPRMDLGKGTLIVRYTDYNNNQGEPQIYTNYLEANTSLGADTKVQLFEEGDYEVALIYEVTSDQFIDQIGHYRIFFEFSVRNGNCMIYPMDLVTGSEMSNSVMTENGFKIDLAKSRYLQVSVKREVLSDSADGLVEDTRFNGIARDGAEYTTEGIYTISAVNEYTQLTTTKKIYVGTNDIMKAHMVSGMSIADINLLLEEGATIGEDGELILPVIVEESASKSSEVVVVEAIVESSEVIEESDTDISDVEQVEASLEETTEYSLWIILAVAGILAILLFASLFIRSNKKNKELQKKLAEREEKR